MSDGSFGQRLAAAVAARESQIVLGLDPDPVRLWPHAGSAAISDDATAAIFDALERAQLAPGPEVALATRAAAAVLAHCRALIDAAGSACVAVKPQLACFERLGAMGWLALQATCAHARSAGLLVLLDGKRGDVPVTAAAYAQSLLVGTPSPWGHLAALRGDAVTVNPLIGRDALDPLISAARLCGAGVFVLVRTSNQGATDVMDSPMADRRPLWEGLAEMVRDLGRPGTDAREPSDVGAVTGATAAKHLGRMRELMPHAPFLLPGVGAQGGRVQDLAPAFAGGRAFALVTASRSIAQAHEQHGGEPPYAARAEAERMRKLAWSLADG